MFMIVLTELVSNQNEHSHPLKISGKFGHVEPQHFLLHKVFCVDSAVAHFVHLEKDLEKAADIHDLSAEVGGKLGLVVDNSGEAIPDKLTKLIKNIIVVAVGNVLKGWYRAIWIYKRNEHISIRGTNSANDCICIWSLAISSTENVGTLKASIFFYITITISYKDL